MSDKTGFPKVAISDGSDILGTLAHPVRVDPTGTTVQPVSVSSFPSPTPLVIDATGQATVSTVTSIIALNASRAAVLITNTSTTSGTAGTVFLGPTNGVLTTTGHALLAGNSITIPALSAVWGITTGASILVTYMELS